MFLFWYDCAWWAQIKLGEFINDNVGVLTKAIPTVDDIYFPIFPFLFA